MTRRVGRRALAVLLALAVVGVLVWAGGVVRDRFDRTDLERALAVAPSGSARVSFTDWRAVRSALDAGLGDTPSRDEVQAMVGAAYDRDLSAASGVDEAAGAMQQLFGFGPGTAQWEVYAQSTDGAALVLRLPDGTDLGVLGENLASAGYARPDDADGVWEGGVDLVASLDPTLTPVVQYVALLPGGLVVTSDTAPYAEEAADVASGDGDAVLGDDGVRAMADRLGDTAAGVMWTGDFACQDLAMASADPDAQQQAAARVEELGGVTPLAGLAMGLRADDGRLRVVAHFDDADQAERDLRARAELAAGTAYGRGGEFGSDFTVARARTLGADLVLDLTPRRDGAFLLSGLYDGPVVFATC